MDTFYSFVSSDNIKRYLQKVRSKSYKKGSLISLSFSNLLLLCGLWMFSREFISFGLQRESYGRRMIIKIHLHITLHSLSPGLLVKHKFIISAMFLLHKYLLICVTIISIKHLTSLCRTIPDTLALLNLI